METTVFRARMSAVAEAFDDEEYDDALSDVRQLKHDLIAAARLPGAHHGKDEGVQLGWARFYEFKCLFATERHQDAHDLLETPEPVSCAIGAKNAGWMYSAGAECAMRVGDLVRLQERGERCYEFRKLLPDDPMSMFHCVNTMLALLDEAGRPDLNRVWAERLIAIGRDFGAERPVIAGVRSLLDNYERSRDGAVADAARAVRDDLVEYCGGEFGDEAADALARLDRVCPAA